MPDPSPFPDLDPDYDDYPPPPPPPPPADAARREALRLAYADAARAGLLCSGYDSAGWGC